MRERERETTIRRRDNLHGRGQSTKARGDWVLRGRLGNGRGGSLTSSLFFVLPHGATLIVSLSSIKPSIYMSDGCICNNMGENL